MGLLSPDLACGQAPQPGSLGCAVHHHSRAERCVSGLDWHSWPAPGHIEPTQDQGQLSGQQGDPRTSTRLPEGQQPGGGEGHCV